MSWINRGFSIWKLDGYKVQEKKKSIFYHWIISWVAFNQMHYNSKSIMDYKSKIITLQSRCQALKYELKIYFKF